MEQPMRIKATYNDGFTERLLRWELVVNTGKAYLEADWFKSRSPLRAKFRFDEAPFRLALASISEMVDEYHAPWGDMEHRTLVVTDEETTIRRYVYGADLLGKEHREVERFLAVWQLLEDAVFAQLPAELRI
jgi:hypothetical protein